MWFSIEDGNAHGYDSRRAKERNQITHNLTLHPSELFMREVGFRKVPEESL
jgi:hypothetical protein